MLLFDVLLQATVNGGVTNFGTLIVKGFGYATCEYYPLFYASSIISADFLSGNDSFANSLRRLYRSCHPILCLGQRRDASE